MTVQTSFEILPPAASAVRDLLIGREYLRVSVDRWGNSKSQGEQHVDNERACGPFGIQLSGEAYCDTGSASQFSRKRRDDFEQLIEDLRNYAFGANVLVLWESARGSRTADEWVTLLGLCRDRNVLIFVTTHSRLYDPRNARDRKSLLEDAIDSEYDSAKTSLRVKRDKAEAAERGALHGRVPYGYKRNYRIDPDTQKRICLGQVPNPDEAKWVGELFERVLKGESIKAISIDFMKRGFRSRKGKVVHSSYLGTLLRRAVYAGLRHHVPDWKHNRPPDIGMGTIYPGKWKAIVSPEDFYAVQKMLGPITRNKPRNARAVHFLTRIGRCDECGGKLTVNMRESGSGSYVCHLRGCVRVNYRDLNAYVEALLLEFLSNSDWVNKLVAKESNDAEIQALRDQLAAARSDLRQLEDDVEAGEVTPRMASKAERKLVPQIEQLQADIAALETPPVMRGLLTAGEDAQARWESSELSTRREIASRLFVRGVLGELRITKVGKPFQRVDVAERIKLLEPAA